MLPFFDQTNLPPAGVTVDLKRSRDVVIYRESPVGPQLTDSEAERLRTAEQKLALQNNDNIEGLGIYCPHPVGGGFANTLARVRMHAFLGCRTIVGPNGAVSAGASVYGTAKVDGGVFGTAEVFDNATIYSEATIRGSCKLFGEAKLIGRTRLSGSVRVGGNIRLINCVLNGAFSIIGDFDAEGIIIENCDMFHGRKWVFETKEQLLRMEETLLSMKKHDVKPKSKR